MTSEYSDCLLTFMTILDQIKLYHWQTLSFARHKATDDLYNTLNKLVDEFIETLHGRLLNDSLNNPLNDSKSRILLSNRNTIFLKNIKDENGFELLKNIKDYLEGNDLLKIIKNYTDLQNIRDEMLGIINKTNYLFSLN